MYKVLCSRRCILVALLLIITLLTACEGQPHLSLIWPETGPALIPEFARGTDGTLYLMDEEGTLHAVTAQGQERWTYRGDHVSTSAPIVSWDGTSIYLTTTNGKLISVGNDGKPQWTFKANDAFRAPPAIAPDGSIYLRLRSGGPPTVVSRTQVIADFNGHTVVLPIDVLAPGANGHRVSPDGKGQPLQWTAKTEYAFGPIAFDSQGRLFLGYLLDHQILSLAANGEDYGQCEAQGILRAGPVVTHKDVLLYTLVDGTLVAQTTTCQELWRYPVSVNGNLQADYPIALGADDTVYVGGPAGQITALSADSGQLQWQSLPNPALGNVATLIASDDGRVYAATNLARLLGFERGNLVWSRVLSGPGMPGPLQTTREGGLALVQDGRLLVYTQDAILAHARPTPVPPQGGTAQAEQEIGEFMLDVIVRKEIGSTAGYIRNSGEPWLSNPPQANLIVWGPADVTSAFSDRLQSINPTRVWWFANNQLTETEDKQKSISEFRQRTMSGSSRDYRYFEFRIISIAEDRQSATVFVGMQCGGPLCAGGSFYTLQRSPGGKWQIVKLERPLIQ